MIDCGYRPSTRASVTRSFHRAARPHFGIRRAYAGSPESFLQPSATLDESSHVWALGIVVLAIATGFLPTYVLLEYPARFGAGWEARLRVLAAAACILGTPPPEAGLEHFPLFENALRPGVVPPGAPGEDLASRVCRWNRQLDGTGVPELLDRSLRWSAQERNEFMEGVQKRRLQLPGAAAERAPGGGERVSLHRDASSPARPCPTSKRARAGAAANCVESALGSVASPVSVRESRAAATPEAAASAAAASPAAAEVAAAPAAAVELPARVENDAPQCACAGNCLNPACTRRRVRGSKEGLKKT